MKIRDSVLLALLTTTLIAVPVASQNVEIEEGDKYSGVMESEFSDRFELKFEEGMELLDMMDSQARLEINKSYEGTVEKLKTSKGVIKNIRNPREIVEKVRTPYGNFTEGVKDGENFSTYSGENREKAEEIRRELRDEMEESMDEADQRRKIVVSRMLPDVEMSVENDHDIEHLNLTNREDEPVDLEGWSILSEGSGKDSLELKGEIAPGETQTYIGTAGETDLEGEETSLTIYSGSAEITLYNSQERIVDSLEY